MTATTFQHTDIAIDSGDMRNEAGQLLTLSVLLAQVNRLVNRTYDEASLLQGISDLIASAYTGVQLGCFVRINANNQPGNLLTVSGQDERVVEFVRSLAHSGLGVFPPLPGPVQPSFDCPVELAEFPPGLQSLMNRLDIRTRTVVPVLRAGEPWAVLWLLCSDAVPLLPSACNILVNLAEDLSNGLERMDAKRHQLLLQQELIRARNYQHALFQHNAAGILIVDRERMIMDVNPALCAMLKFSPADLLGKSVVCIHFSHATYLNFQGKFNEALHSTGTVQTEYQFRRQDGTTLWAKILGAKINLSDGNPGVLWSIVDTSDLHDAQEKLGHQAMHDMLTGLPNRRSLDVAIEQSMAIATRQGWLLAVMMLDLDNFKPINDTYGHDAGDEVLRIIAQRLKQTLRRSDFVARLGGDEFVLLLGGSTRVEEFEPIFAKLEQTVCLPIALNDGVTVHVGLSAGVGLYPLHEARNADVLLRYADQSLYASKEHKRTRSRYWVLHGDPVRLRQSPAQRMLEQHGVEVWYQPVMDSIRGEVVGIEALARLRDEAGRLWHPGDFLPQLQSADFLRLTCMVFDHALADLAELDRYGQSLWLSVNLHPHSVSEECVACLLDKISQGPIDPARITLEIMEGSNFQEQEMALRHLLALRDQGVHLALDDVGIAYSSLQRIQELPIDKIKLDQSFVRTLRERPQDMHFIRSIQELATGLGIALIVEGVETVEILDAVRMIGVNYVQGYVVAQPMPFAELVEHFRHPLRLPRHDWPDSLLGLYAMQFVHHTSVIRVIRQHPQLIDLQTLADPRACPIHAALLKIGIGEDEDLHHWHNEYHAAFAACMSQSSPLDCSRVEQAQNRIDEGILSALQLAG